MQQDVLAKQLGSTDCDLLPDMKAAEAPLLVLGIKWSYRVFSNWKWCR